MFCGEWFAAGEGMEEKGKMMMAFRSFLVGAVAAAGLMASAATSVTVGNVKTGEPWSTITVDYTLGGVEADLDYKVAFDVTANGVTRGVTNAAAKLADGTASKVIDTAALFGAASADPKAKVRVSLIAVKPQLGGVQLWENGPYWAECNVGATKPEEYGYYFWWGDTVGYKRNASDTGWVSSQNGASFSFTVSDCLTYGKDTAPLQSAGYIDATGNLVAQYDAATAHLGAPWRMPTDAEYAALIDNCDTEWTTRNGVAGRLVKGRGAYATKSIFLPAAGLGYDSDLTGPGSYGNVWSSTPYSDYSDRAWGLDFNLGGYYSGYNCHRNFGRTVRPVK